MNDQNETGRESAVAEALCRAAHAWPFDPGNDFPCSTCTARAKVAVAALDTPPTLGEDERAALTAERRRRFVKAADSTLAVRRSVLRLAAHATGHKKHPHGEECEECKERWPCTSVLRAAGPTIDAIADMPSIHLAARAHQPTPPERAEAVAAVERVRALADEFEFGTRAQRLDRGHVVREVRAALTPEQTP